MAAFQQTVRNMGTQLGGMPATAKLLFAALMVILVMSLLMVAQFSSRQQLVPLAAQLSPEAQAQAITYMQTNQIEHEVAGNNVLVPPDQKYTVLAQLSEGRLLGADQINFDKLIAQDSPFLTRDQHNKRWMIAKMNVLASLISSFSGIESATVVIDQPVRSGFGRSHVQAVASVNVIPRGELTSQQVEAIAHLVAGSHAGLSPANVVVVDAKTGQRHVPRSDDQLAMGKHLELKQKTERDFKAKLEEFLQWIPGVVIGVNALVDSRAVEERTDAYEEPKLGLTREQSEFRESINSSTAAEPGMRPNAGATIGSGSTSTTSKVTEEKSDTRMKPFAGATSAHIIDPRGYALKINATILIPRSYFVNRYRLDRNEPDATPDDQTLKPIVDAEKADIKLAVEPLIDTVALSGTVLGKVVVDMIPDLVTAVSNFGAGGGGMSSGGSFAQGGGGAAGAVVGSSGGSLFDSGLLKQLILGGLALLALALMLMMVRKAGRMDLPTPQEVAGVPPPLPSEDDAVVGEAEESDLALEGVELDDEQLRRQQLLSQISTMVKEDPDEVANLLRRWITIET